jgi:hypothetical protein
LVYDTETVLPAQLVDVAGESFISKPAGMTSTRPTFVKGFVVSFRRVIVNTLLPPAWNLFGENDFASQLVIGVTVTFAFAVIRFVIPSAVVITPCPIEFVYVVLVFTAPEGVVTVT